MRSALRFRKSMEVGLEVEKAGGGEVSVKVVPVKVTSR